MWLVAAVLDGTQCPTPSHERHRHSTMNYPAWISFFLLLAQPGVSAEGVCSSRKLSRVSGNAERQRQDIASNRDRQMQSQAFQPFFLVCGEKRHLSYQVLVYVAQVRSAWQCCAYTYNIPTTGGCVLAVQQNKCSWKVQRAKSNCGVSKLLYPTRVHTIACGEGGVSHPLDFYAKQIVYSRCHVN